MSKKIDWNSQFEMVRKEYNQELRDTYMSLKNIFLSEGFKQEMLGAFSDEVKDNINNGKVKIPKRVSFEYFIAYNSDKIDRFYISSAIEKLKKTIFDDFEIISLTHENDEDYDGDTDSGILNITIRPKLNK